MKRIARGIMGAVLGLVAEIIVFWLFVISFDDDYIFVIYMIGIFAMGYITFFVVKATSEWLMNDETEAQDDNKED